MTENSEISSENPRLSDNSNSFINYQNILKTVVNDIKYLNYQNFQTILAYLTSCQTTFKAV